MSKIISIHSFRGGTGKSNTTANLAYQIAASGKRVGVVDTDIQSPGIHVLFGLDEGKLNHALNDYLWGHCGIEQTAYDVTVNIDPNLKGQLFLVPSSIKVGEIARVMREGYDVGLLNEGFRQLIGALNLDVLMIDTHPGLNEETLLSIAISDTLLVVLRPDQQDFQGTGVTLEVARKLDVPNLMLLVNKVPSVYDPLEVKARVEKAFNSRVGEVIPHSDALMALASEGIFSQKFPDDPVSLKLKQLAASLVA